MDKFREECGVFGIYGKDEASNLSYLGLYALQHRGQESAGIVSFDQEKKRFYVHRSLGLVNDIFDEETLADLPGRSAIGHVRYSTYGGTLENAQPFVVNDRRGGLAIAHNGNLVNAGRIRKALEENGSIFQSTMDTEVIVHVLASIKVGSLVERLTLALNQILGSYSLVILTEGNLIAVRDPHGFRPLVLGELDGSFVVASETCALDLIEARYIRDVEPGEILIINEKGVHSHMTLPKKEHSFCIFEYIYFARPDSIVFGQNVYTIRKLLGAKLAQEDDIEADLVLPVPDSGVPAAVGYSQAAKIPFEFGLIRNHYVGRTFIEPSDGIRHFGVKIKLNPVHHELKGKKVVVIDDSIVRGTTSKKIIGMIRSAGAKEIHMRISSPPTTHSCYYGIDTPTRDELIASKNTIDEIGEFIGVDSLKYLTIEGMMESVDKTGLKFCNACFTGKYPVLRDDTDEAAQLVLFPRRGKAMGVI
ncbi:MAG: amidophosphoribosyltransferase [Deltaproteobacteria bacterium]|uniref:Amidophosphoribosyltransferase n=1 Tax=Candidatus Zymogenus saltonus TaxID=2844893 RepID=A0A9D8KE23_9DELT|nr:amidophosphoribosyltransferase [Candidatus Zymogenus saltonus]